jgi:hypothetical protein
MFISSTGAYLPWQIILLEGQQSQIRLRLFKRANRLDFHDWVVWTDQAKLTFHLICRCLWVQICSKEITKEKESLHPDSSDLQEWHPPSCCPMRNVTGNRITPSWSSNWSSTEDTEAIRRIPLSKLRSLCTSPNPGLETFQSVFICRFFVTTISANFANLGEFACATVAKAQIDIAAFTCTGEKLRIRLRT